MVRRIGLIGTPLAARIALLLVLSSANCLGDGLQIPWAIAFLPDGDALVSERAADRIVRLDFETGAISELIGGPDDVYVNQNGGMLYVVLHPDYAGNRLVYYCYSAGDGLTDKEGMEQPIHYYVPSIAPSDMFFYTGDAFPDWRGSPFLGALAGAHLNRLVVEGRDVVHEERLLEDPNWRVRMVDQGPDDLIYLGVDSGSLCRSVPDGEAP